MELSRNNLYLCVNCVEDLALVRIYHTEIIPTVPNQTKTAAIVEDALGEIAKGMVIVTDDESRENEGDFDHGNFQELLLNQSIT